MKKPNATTDCQLSFGIKLTKDHRHSKKESSLPECLNCLFLIIVDCENCAESEEFGADDAVNIANTRPPAALVGKWGSVHSAEERLLRGGLHDATQLPKAMGFKFLKAL